MSGANNHSSDAETAEEAENIADDMNFRGEIDWSSDVETDGGTVVRELKP